MTSESTTRIASSVSIVDVPTFQQSTENWGFGNFKKRLEKFRAPYEDIPSLKISSSLPSLNTIGLKSRASSSVPAFPRIFSTELRKIASCWKKGNIYSKIQADFKKDSESVLRWQSSPNLSTINEPVTDGSFSKRSMNALDENGMKDRARCGNDDEDFYTSDEDEELDDDSLKDLLVAIRKSENHRGSIRKSLHTKQTAHSPVCEIADADHVFKTISSFVENNGGVGRLKNCESLGTRVEVVQDVRMIHDQLRSTMRDFKPHLIDGYGGCLDEEVLASPGNSPESPIILEDAKMMDGYQYLMDMEVSEDVELGLFRNMSTGFNHLFFIDIQPYNHCVDDGCLHTKKIEGFSTVSNCVLNWLKRKLPKVAIVENYDVQEIYNNYMEVKELADKLKLMLKTMLERVPLSCSLRSEYWAREIFFKPSKIGKCLDLPFAERYSEDEWLVVDKVQLEGSDREVLFHYNVGAGEKIHWHIRVRHNLSSTLDTV